MAERALEMTSGPYYTNADLQHFLGTEEFFTIPLGSKDEGLQPDGTVKRRNIQDGNRAGLSGLIHKHTWTKGELPGIQDQRHGMAVCHQTRTKIITLKFDIRKAHRRTAVPPHEWRYLVVTLYDRHGTPEWWVNLVHTYGVASAQHYWGRTAALFLRLLYQLLGPDL